jgi:glycoprotein 6-alpha-L-fucosyltransferase
MKRPIVGVHIRRGNKVTEVSPEPLENYMKKVQEFYDIYGLSQKLDKKRVFIVSDDPKVVDEAKDKYPDYEFVFNHEFSSNVSNYQSKNTSALPIYIDIQLMAMCDTWIGTFSSNLGRRFYAALYWLHKDVNTFSKSLDYRYYENYDNEIRYKIIIEHEDVEQNATFSVGDIGILLGIDDKIGVFPLKSTTTGKTVNIPKFKLEKLFDTVNMPVFDN